MALPMEGVNLLYPTFNLIPEEEPLSDGGKWNTYYWSRPPLRASDSGSTVHGTVEFPVNGSYYSAQSFTGDVVEAYACTPGTGLGAAVESQRVVALVGNPFTYNGYSSMYGGGIGEQYFLRKYTNGTNVLEIAGPGGPPPEKLGIRLTPTAVEQWAYYSGTWNLTITMADTAYRGTTWFALETEEQGGTEEVGFSCFGAGVVNRTQIYRIIRGKAAIGA